MRVPSKKDEKNPTVQVHEELRLFNLSIYRSVALIHGIGYGLILFASLDIFFLFISQSWLAPGWFLTVLEQFVASVPVLLVGLGLSFFGERKPRLHWEINIVRGLSWFSLILSVVFLLLIPLGIYSTVQVVNQNEQNITTHSQFELFRLNTLEEKVSETKSLKELQKISQIIGNSSEVKDLKQGILQKIKSQESQIEINSNSKIFNSKFKTIKKIAKLIISTLLASLIYFWLWKSTAWSRGSKVI